MSLNRMAVSALTLTTALTATAASADGVEQLYQAWDNAYMGEMIIMGDVNLIDDGEMAWFEVPEQDMWIYIPTQAAYITLDANNPIIRDSWKFEGWWVSTLPPHLEYGITCDYPAYDHTGTQRLSHGGIDITYTGIEDGYKLYFNMGLGTCYDPLQDWAYNDYPDTGGYTAPTNNTGVVTKK